MDQREQDERDERDEYQKDEARAKFREDNNLVQCGNCRDHFDLRQMTTIESALLGGMRTLYVFCRDCLKTEREVDRVFECSVCSDLFMKDDLPNWMKVYTALGVKWFCGTKEDCHA